MSVVFNVREPQTHAYNMYEVRSLRLSMSHTSDLGIYHPQIYMAALAIRISPLHLNDGNLCLGMVFASYVFM